MKRKGQEEMVGFALILIIIAIVIVVLVSFSIKPSEEVLESYEAESFILALLGTTTQCEIGFEFRTVQELISDCSSNNLCLDEKSACIELENAVNGSLSEGWGKQNGVVGYLMEIWSGDDRLISQNIGNSSRTYKGFEYYADREIRIKLKVYEVIS